MLKIGSHLSVAKGFTAMGKQALKMDANTFQFFTRNPRGGKAKEIDIKDIEGLIKIMEENSLTLAHGFPRLWGNFCHMVLPQVRVCSGK